MLALTVPPPIIPSVFQEDVYEWVRRHLGHQGQASLVVEAVAGSGKTTTLVEISKILPMGARTVFVAFNKHVAEELAPRVNGMEVKTAHSLGYGALMKKLGRLQMDNRKYAAMCTEAAHQLVPILRTKFTEEQIREAPLEYDDLRSNLSRIVDLSMLAAIRSGDIQSIVRVAENHGIDGNSAEETELMCEVAADIIEQGVRIAEQQSIISFTDMIYLPLRWELSLPYRDWILVDECQDLSPAILELILKMRGPRTRMVFVGDRRQAIFLFAGAGADSVDRIIERTQAEELPLSICYRCPTSVLELARVVVPQIQSRPDAPVGVTGVLRRGQVADHVQKDDLILCRTTAPLVALCITLIRNKIAATVRGRDISKGLTKIVRDVAKIDGFTFAEFQRYLDLHRDRMLAKLLFKRHAEEQITQFNDASEGVRVCYESFTEAKTVDQLMQSIENLFSDEASTVSLSTVHRAKGLESRRVMILHPEKLPLSWRGQRPEEQVQEMNLRYVAVTRAKEELLFITDTEGWWPANLVVPLPEADQSSKSAATSSLVEIAQELERVITEPEPRYDLAPCPFCGDVDVEVILKVAESAEEDDPSAWWPEPYWIVGCACGARGPRLYLPEGTPQRAADAWNAGVRRAYGN